MRGFCGKCGRTFDGQMLCPACGVQLQEDQGAASAMSLALPAAEELPDGPSFARRLTFGAVTLLGLYHGLKHLALAAVLARAGATALTSDGHLSLLVLATLIAAVVAGTVNRRAELTGFLLAGAGGAAFLAPDLAAGGLPEEWVIGVPTLLALVGVIGGFCGRLMVPPAPSLPNFGRLDSRVMVRVKRRPVRIAWAQLFLGVTIAVTGAVLADTIRSGLSYLLAGRGQSVGVRSLMTWQISMLAALGGGAAACVHTRGGVRQGLVTAAGAAFATAVAVAAASTAEPSPIIEFWMYQLDLKEAGLLPVAAVGLTTLIATALGGWIGVHAFPAGGRK
jgi:hypothetical protein